MGRLNVSTYVLSILGILLSGILAWKLNSDGKDAYTIVSAVGSVASFFGLIIAIVQIASLKSTSEAIRLAIKETKDQLILNISISDVSKALKILEQVQTHSRHREYSLAHLRLQDLRTLLLQFKGDARFIKTEEQEKYTSLLTDVGIHIINLYNVIFEEEKTIDVTAINQTLEEIAAILVSFESQLKFEG